jgi:uncharacterized protein
LDWRRFWPVICYPGCFKRYVGEAEALQILFVKGLQYKWYGFALSSPALKPSGLSRILCGAIRIDRRPIFSSKKAIHEQGEGMTVFKEAGQLLRIFIGEANKYKRMPLYEWIVQQARFQGMAGATVLRGIQGFGANSLIHTTKILRLSEDLPVVVEIIDTKEKIESFLQAIDHAITEGIVTVEKAQVRLYRAGGKKRG